MNYIFVMNDSIADHIGKKVFKRSGKLFKSMSKVNTVKSVILHPYIHGTYAFMFEEDDTYISISQCKRVSKYI